jgi:UPF0755 protein
VNDHDDDWSDQPLFHGRDGDLAQDDLAGGTHAGPYDEAPRRRRRRRGQGCLPVAIVLLVIAAGVFFGGRWAYDQVSIRLESAPDFAGPGTGSVVYQVKEGATSTQIARELKAKGVVKSVDAFTEAASSEEKSRDIQVGYYRLKKQMKATEALGVLVDPQNLLQNLVVVPEGARVRSIVDTIVAKTNISRRQVTRALADPAAIGLPAEAGGNPEGFLYPATYSVPPGQTAVGLVRQMVAKTVATEKSLDIATRAQALGLSTEQVLTVASILEYEANRAEDYPKVARVLYNRLEQDMPLQLDSTVSYVSKRSGDVWTTAAERSNTSAYNTYAHKGLPPGPIGSPGEATIEAALSPAKGSWLFFVPDYENHTTHFSTTLAEHNRWVAKLRAYCLKSDDC